jgi:transposase
MPNTSIIDLKDAKIAELEAKVASLESELAWLRKKVFGKMSEKMIPADPMAEPTLFDLELSESESASIETLKEKDEEVITKIITVKTNKENRKAIDTSKLPVEEEHIYPEGVNAEEYAEMEPEITETLAIRPAQMYVKRIIRHKYVLKSSLQIKDPERQAFIIASLPPVPIYKSMASGSILADIIIEKFFYHMPFYRVIQKYKELGVSISSSTMGDWYAAICEKLKLLYDILKNDVLLSDYIQVDESTLPVIDNEKHRAVKGYMWVVRNAVNGDVFFHYDMGSRSTETALKLLKDYQGAIQTDGYQAYEHFEGMKGKKMLGCWAHSRRKFYDALTENKRLAEEGIEYISKLYKTEDETSGMTAEQRAEIRQKEAYPVIREFEIWMQNTAGKVLKTGRMYKAIQYTYGLLPRLRRYVQDGRYNIDNNLIENAIRPLAVGRKNYLFCGNAESAIRAGIVYSLIASCKSAGIEPRIWLEDILNKIPIYETTGGDLSKLLPRNWKQSQQTLPIVH